MKDGYARRSEPACDRLANSGKLAAIQIAVADIPVFTQSSCASTTFQTMPREHIY
ncbi:hypothetical protein WN51_10832 [Melipona quadrifasciata]|uniref:Uncharacterized protein n=1 Tax=Melipona quadrifasciata TaxID=166423 RepID=A0A0M9A5N7_9HYME|nr:hypothetical protein WN51_10832 [Melipona quadrifasciata]